MITPGALERATERALRSGALQPIETRVERVADAGVPFMVRVASSIARKAALGNDAGKPDPLGDYEPALFVCEAPPAHYVLLNKFYVVPAHLLVVTRAFEDQRRLLGEADFAAVAPLLESLGGLAFYNGGREAGASQARKHLQLVQMPIPLEPLITRGSLPFRHAVAPAASAGGRHALYRELLARCGISCDARGCQTAPYNLLFTREWMLVVPRRCERFESISLNALAFAGSLFVRDDAALELVRRRGPMQALRSVAIE